ncbi:hypothetical protein C8J56DRAFT_1157921 [Mycena floridula]|nr:hypothetical protein C8J56DRAFT_1157921 [Mycena floridula]
MSSAAPAPASRRKRHKKTARDDESTTSKTKARKMKKPEEPLPDSAFTAADFIPFGDDSDQEQNVATSHSEDKGKEKPVREWDAGKKSNGKRSFDEMVFDENELLVSHSESYNTQRSSPWLAGLDLRDCASVSEVFHREVEAFSDWISPTPVEDELRALTVLRIARAVVQAFPDAQVLAFGSYETKLYLPLGDIDLVVMSKSMGWNDKHSVLQALASAIKRSGITNKVTVIAKARVPLVKFVTTLGNLKVDMSYNQPSGLVGGKIVNGFLKDMQSNKALRSLVLIVKAFLSQRSMNEVYTGGLGSYSIVCLVVSFLQLHPKIRSGEIDPEKNLGVLTMEFFELYGCYFNYEGVGISVRDGGSYFSKRQRGWFDFAKPLGLSIEDPADISNDVSSGSYGFPRVRATFAGAFSILSTTAYRNAKLLNSSRRRSSHELGILASILGVTKETIEHRKLMRQIYDNRTLHTILGVKPAPIVVEGPANDQDTKPNDIVEVPESTAVKDTNSNVEETPSKGIDFDSGDEFVKEGPSLEDIDLEEGGRYDIARSEPPNKRRRLGLPMDAHTVFTTDDEGDVDSLDEEEEEYKSGSESKAVTASEIAVGKNSLSSKSRRSYWLSKGISS